MERITRVLGRLLLVATIVVGAACTRGPTPQRGPVSLSGWGATVVGERVLAVEVPSCNGDPVVDSVVESEDAVRIRIVSSLGSADICLDVVDVELAAPLGDRVLIDDVSGTTILVDGGVWPSESPGEELGGSWGELPAGPAVGRSGHVAAWTGSEMLVWGGTRDSEDRADGAAFDPVATTWRVIGQSPLLPRTDAVGVWTGDRLLVWGGVQKVSGRVPRALDDGALYDPTTDEWEAMADFPLSPRQYASITWTGHHLLVWGGISDLGQDPTELADGARFDPGSNTWSTMPVGPLAPRFHAPAVWTGSEMLVWRGGVRDAEFQGEAWFSEPTTDGAAYDPTTDTWRDLDVPDKLHELPQVEVTSAWSGAEVVAWTGTTDAVEDDDAYAAGYRWDPATGDITPLSPAPVLGAPELRDFPGLHVRFDTTSAATGDGYLFTWGGSIGEGGNHTWDLGFAYELAGSDWYRLPPTGDPARAGNSVVWTGAQLLVWGGYQDAWPHTPGAEVTWSDSGHVWTPPSPLP